MATENDPAVNAMAREGGLARARALTPAERSEAARKAANARWDRYNAGRHRPVSELAPVSNEADDLISSVEMLAYRLSPPSSSPRSRDTINKVEMDAYAEIWTKAQNHEISATCPCDECVDSVMVEIRKRYLELLTRIDRGEKLDKGEGVLFQLLTGGKANRWTRVYRQACKAAKR